MRTRHMQMVLIAGLALVALSACGDSGSDGGGVASLGGDDSDSSGQTSEQAALEWARCMRDEGVDIPDPTTDEDGNVEFQVGSGGHIDMEAFADATEVCGEPPGREMSSEDESAMQDAALEFAECMRDKGYDVPDPDFNDGHMSFGQDANLDMNDPEVQADMNECQEAFADLRPGGEQ